MNIQDVLAIYAEISPQLRGNFKAILEKIPEQDFENFAQGLNIPEQNYKLLLTFLSNNWGTLATRSKDEILHDLAEPLKTYLSKNDTLSLKKLTLKTLNEYKGIKKEVGTGASGWQVIEITDVDTCIRLTKDSGWCVQNEQYARQYLDEDSLYMILRNGKRFALLHFESDSYMDPHDNPLSMKELTMIKENLPEFVDEHPRFRYHYLKEMGAAAGRHVELLLERNDIQGLQQLINETTEINLGGIIHASMIVKTFRKTNLDHDMMVLLKKNYLLKPNILTETIPYLEMETGQVIERIVFAFANAGFDLDDGTSKEWGTPLYAAAVRGAAVIVEKLLELGANPNAQNASSHAVPLHGAAMKGGSMAETKGAIQVATLLLDAGADINAVNINGSTPLDYVKNQSSEMAQFLRSRGAKSAKPKAVL